MVTSRRGQGWRLFAGWVVVAVWAALLSPVVGAAPAAATAAPGTISTFAGGNVGDGGPATQAQLSAPNGVAVDAAGNILIVDERHNRLRRVDTHGIITTFAGTGARGFSGDGGPATKARLNINASPGIAVDRSGNVFFADNVRIRKVDTRGIITTVAGGGNPADGVGDNGPALAAAISSPNGLAVNSSGELFISDASTVTVRKVDTSGVITRVAGNGTQGLMGDGGPATSAEIGPPAGLAVDTAGDLLIADGQNARVRKVVPGADGKINGDGNDIITTVAGSVAGFAGDGGPATRARLTGASGVALDQGGAMFIADDQNRRIRKVDANGIITTYAGDGGTGYSGDGGPAVAAQFNVPNALAVDPAGNVVIVDAVPGSPGEGNNVIRRVDTTTGVITTVAGGGVGDGRPASQAALSSPWGITTSTGSTYITENDTGRVRKVGPGGRITTLAGGGSVPMGDGGSATAATLNQPSGVTVDAQGDLLIADTGNNRVRKVTPEGTITTVAGGGSPTHGVGDRGPATAASLNGPAQVIVDASGNILICDSGHNRVRKVNHASGIISTIAGNGAPPSGTVVDGIPATHAAIDPGGIALDGHGNLFIADVGDNRIRKVDTTGIITTVAGNGTSASSGDGGPALAAGVQLPEGVSIDPAGNLYVASVAANVIRKVVPGADGILNGGADEIITTVAGGGSPPDGVGDGRPATAAALNFPVMAAVDPMGNLLVADMQNSRIRKVDHSGNISTLTGNGLFGFSGDGGPAAAATVSRPFGVSFDAEGDVLFPDQFNNRIREINTNGIITTVAGGGVGDGLAATSIAMNSPKGVAVDTAGNVFIADCGSGRVRKVDTTTGLISTVAGGGSPSDGVGDGGAATGADLACPTGLLWVPAPANPLGGSLYVADCPSTTDPGLSRVTDITTPAANRVRLVDSSGTITTVAGIGRAGFTGDGSLATLAQLRCPSDIRLDSAGRLLIADRDNNRVRRVSRTGVISTLAGDGGNGFATGGRATTAHVNNPTGLAVDAAGDVFIAENSHARVTKVDRKGIITTVAGQGVTDFTGDGGPATLATLSFPTQVALDAAGDLLITDGTSNNHDFPRPGNQRVRMVTAGTPAPPPPGCGEIITTNTTLTSDLGPCPVDGIIVGADGITLNLNGHKIVSAGPGDGAHAGIRLTSRKGVTVTNGTVTGFAAGVALLGGSGNTISHMTLADNHGPPPPAQPEFGDGIALLFSAHNRVSNNAVLRNGPYDGIAIEGLGASFNTIEHNTVLNSDQGPGIISNPFLDSNLPGRGGSNQGNDMIGNTVEGNGGAGISNLSNQNALISGNLVQNNGFNDPLNSLDNGIGIQALQNADPNTNDTVDGNTVHGNARDGIQAVRAQMNHITNNNAANNAVGDGSASDLADSTRDPITFEQNCTTNVWFNNTWGAGGFSPPCTATGGTGPNPPSSNGANRPLSRAAEELPPLRHLTPDDAATARSIIAVG